MVSYPVAIIGAGKVARDEYIPAITEGDSFVFVAMIHSSTGIDGGPNFADLAALPARGPRDLRPAADAWRVRARFNRSNTSELFEKPSALTLNELVALTEMAGAADVRMSAASIGKKRLICPGAIPNIASGVIRVNDALPLVEVAPGRLHQHGCSMFIAATSSLFAGSCAGSGR